MFLLFHVLHFHHYSRLVVHVLHYFVLLERADCSEIKNKTTTTIGETNWKRNFFPKSEWEISVVEVFAVKRHTNKNENKTRRFKKKLVTRSINNQTKE